MSSVQVAVVGGGPAGLSAAIAAVRSGASVRLFDENRAFGGQLRYRIADVPGRGSPPRLAEALIGEARDAGVDLRGQAVVWGLFTDRTLAVAESESSYHLHADQIVLATGSTDLPFTFPGGSLPGVLTTRAVQILLHVHRVLPGKRFAVIGRGAEAEEVGRDIALAGGQVIAAIDPGRDGGDVAADGSDHVRAVTVRGARYDVDVIVIAVGRQPDAELALMAECDAGYAPDLGGIVPVRDGLLRTSVTGLLVGGDAAGVCDVTTAMAEGRFAGISAAAALGLVSEKDLASARDDVERAAPGRAPVASSLRPILTHV